MAGGRGKKGGGKGKKGGGKGKDIKGKGGTRPSWGAIVMDVTCGAQEIIVLGPCRGPARWWQMRVYCS